MKQRSKKNLDAILLRMDQERPIYDPLPLKPLKGKALVAATKKNAKMKQYCEAKLTEFIKEIRDHAPALTYRDTRRICAKLEMFIRSDHPRMRGSVVANHDDGSHFFFNYAFYEEISTEWMIVFSEHQGSHPFSMGELSHMDQTH